ncbi:hypothetical protein [Streptomyces noursei]|uniref:hypothetical protein n=1 Tax=Streptomyces noursei TaxID=1971 RepID=UPI0023B88407|nr:hypothetical protein [Streptomyces noursei]
MTMPVAPQQPRDHDTAVIDEVTRLLTEHPIKQAVTSWLSPNALRALQEGALKAALAPEGERREWQPTKYHPIENPSGPPGHGMSD